MSEELVIRYCSPTLAGLKTGSLFSCPYTSKKEIMEQIRRLNQKLVPKGLRVLPVQVRKKHVLVYLYRPSQLSKDFSCEDVRKLLAECGYREEVPERCLRCLIDKLRREGDFPHEIGLFLGYPPEDVRGFIENKAAGSKYSGYWKVYGDSRKAQKLFAQYRRCTRIYCEQWEKGRTVEQLAVAGA